MSEADRKIQALIVDDERLARKRIRSLLKNERDVEVVGECADGAEALAAIRKQNPDLVFLDVQMPEMDGFQVLQSVGADLMPAVVFVTAYDKYALRAFEVHALDYLLKPFDEDRFGEALRRAKDQVLGSSNGDLHDRLLALIEHLRSGERYVDRLLVKASGRVLFLKTEDIDWIEAAGNYVRLHVGRESHLLRETMNTIETKLDPARFLRIHRSTIVNLDRIKEMQPWFSGEYVVLLKDGTELRLSRGYRDKFDERLGEAS
jgi:two-component system LytT family response regulator